MDAPPPWAEQAVETRRERLVAMFQARMHRWQLVQTGALAGGTVGLVAYLDARIPAPLALTILVVAALAIAVSAGAQAGHEAEFRREMDGIERRFDRLMRRGPNL